MADWGQLGDYVKANYLVADETTNSMLRLHFSVDDRGERSQSVFVWNVPAQSSEDEDWIQIESVIGAFTKIDLRALLELTKTGVVGGVAVTQDSKQEWVVLRHAVPLADMSVEEFEKPLYYVMMLADSYEQKLTGMDQH